MSADTDPVLLHVKFETYLAQWLINDNGGYTPIVFPKYSIENRILKTYLIPLPPNALPNLPSEDSLPIVIPQYKYGDPKRINYLPVAAMRLLHDAIRERFSIELWTALHQFGHIGKKRQDVLIAWMQSHNIEVTDTNFNALIKIYDRQRDSYLARLRRAKKSSKKSRKKSRI